LRFQLLVLSTFIRRPGRLRNRKNALHPRAYDDYHDFDFHNNDHQYYVVVVDDHDEYDFDHNDLQAILHVYLHVLGLRVKAT